MRLKELRKQKGLTQQEVASHVGITQNNYSYWENEKVKIDNESLRKLADLYGVSIDFLMGREENINSLTIPNNLKDARIAFYGGIEDLTQEDLEDVSRYIEFVKSKKKNN